MKRYFGIKIGKKQMNIMETESFLYNSIEIASNYIEK